MNGHRKSDRPVPKKPTNKAGQPAAELVEERGLAKGKSDQQTRSRTQGRTHLHHALGRIREAARKDKGLRFTALWHHVYNVDHLREAYFHLKRDTAAGVDGETWQHYGEELEANLQALSRTLQAGAYRAKPVRRVYIPKPDGRQRPIGVPALEDKIVQRATAAVLQAIYETDFKGFSYGFRPGRSQHHALDALYVGLMRRKVSWVIDADIRGFFDTISHEWTMKFFEHRIGDRRVLRHIRKWLDAGVLEAGEWRRVDRGTPQGGGISPVIANVYLHYAFDLWADQRRRKQAHGEVIVVRYADDIVVGLQHRADAERFQAALQERLGRFSLELNTEKSRLIEFGRFAVGDRRRRGEGKPETFDFLGLTHICGQNRKGNYLVLRQTTRRRMQAKLHAIKRELRDRLHDPIPEVGRWLQAVVVGHNRYYGVPGNGPAMGSFRTQIARLWYRRLRRRSQRARLTWVRMNRLVHRWLPSPRIYHPYPHRRLIVHHPRQEPRALAAHAGICGGGHG